MTIGSAVTPSALRASSAGTVMRFPWTGLGVARLVALSIVKVDMLPLTRMSRQGIAG